MRIVSLILLCLTALCFAANAAEVEIEPGSSKIWVDAKASPPHTVTSYVRKFQCDLEVDTATMEVLDTRFSFRFSDFDSEHKSRDKKMHAWLESDEFPDVEFQLKEVIQRDNKTVGIGDLKMHGISKSIEIPFTLEKSGEKVVLEGDSTFSHEDWGLKIIRFFLFSVKPELKVHFHLEGTLKDS